jgi:hypothetical protein
MLAIGIESEWEYVLAVKESRDFLPSYQRNMKIMDGINVVRDSRFLGGSLIKRCPILVHPNPKKAPCFTSLRSNSSFPAFTQSNDFPKSQTVVWETVGSEG